MFEKILLPIDFSQQSIMMLDCVAELRQFGAETVIIVHVLPPKGRLSENQRKTAEELVNKLKERGFEAMFKVVHGNPVDEILALAEKEEVTLIVMASSGKGRAQEFFVGSTSFGVVRRTSKPMLIDKFEVIEKDGSKKIKPACTMLFRTALVPIDFSRCTYTVIDALHHLAKRGLRKIVLFHVIESTKYSVSSDKRFDEIKKRLEELESDLSSAGFEVITHVHFGTPAYNILEATREFDASLIIIGASGKSFLKGLALGSTSEEVIRKASVPLLVVRC